MKHEKAQSKAQERRKAPHGPKVQKKAKKKVQKKGQQVVSRKTYHAIKYDDIGKPLESGRINAFWIGQSVIPLYPKFRKGGKAIPKTFRYWDHRFLMKSLGLRGWEFGNWVTQDDRLNYVCASGIAMLDMATALGFPRNQMGLKGKITLAIGARGKTKASAHFEPASFAINLTRYRENPSAEKLRIYGGLLQAYPKTERFLRTGGVGALAHEYGHALDYFFGGYVDQDKNNFSLSGGRSIRSRVDNDLLKQKSMRGDMEKILSAMIWEEKGKLTSFYKGILDYLEKNRISSTYFIRRNELFARAFEQHIHYKLKTKGQSNYFLHQPKYSSLVYMDEPLLKKVSRHIDSLTAKMRAYVRKK